MLLEILNIRRESNRAGVHKVITQAAAIHKEDSVVSFVISQCSDYNTLVEVVKRCKSTCNDLIKKFAANEDNASKAALEIHKDTLCMLCRVQLLLEFCSGYLGFLWL